MVYIYIYILEMHARQRRARAPGTPALGPRDPALGPRDPALGPGTPGAGPGDTSTQFHLNNLHGPGIRADFFKKFPPVADQGFNTKRAASLLTVLP